MVVVGAIVVEVVDVDAATPTVVMGDEVTGALTTGIDAPGTWIAPLGTVGGAVVDEVGAFTVISSAGGAVVVVAGATVVAGADVVVLGADVVVVVAEGAESVNATASHL